MSMESDETPLTEPFAGPAEGEWSDRERLRRALSGKDTTSRIVGLEQSEDSFETEAGVFYRRFHEGIDIVADRGQPVFATAEGEVTKAGYSGDYGNLVVIKHSFGLETRYGHLTRAAVTPGQTVHRGDVVGFVGSTGRSTSPHLHYEVWLNSRLINPLRLLSAR